MGAETKLSRAPHSEAFAALSDTERWLAVGHVRAISLGGTVPLRAGAAPASGGR